MSMTRTDAFNEAVQEVVTSTTAPITAATSHALRSLRLRTALLEGQLRRAIEVLERIEPLQLWMALPDSSPEIALSVDLFIASLKDTVEGKG